jgi:uncharacterized protein involved in exopolysaccharide biosynthesis
MTIQTLETTPVAEPWPANDEIDLRKYLDIVLRWWREILLITLLITGLAVVIVFALRQLMPPTYEAIVDVAIVRTVSNVSFDERFQTTADQLNDAGSTAARRSALLGLATAGGIASEVVAELGQTLTESEQVPAKLMKQVEAEAGPIAGTRGDSDLIRITVVADSPEKAVAIANAWGRAYVRQVNNVYGQVPDDVLTSIEAELVTAKETYEASQAALETFLGSTHLNELTSLATVLQQQIDQEVALVQAYLAEWQQTNSQLSAARALRTQVEQGGEGAARSTMAALQTLKISAYGLPPQNLQMTLQDQPEVSQETMLIDVNGLIGSLEERLQTVEREIAMRGVGLRQAVNLDVTTAVPISATLTSAYNELRQLQAQIEAENARKTQLEQQRDLDRDAYKALSSKMSELNVARAAASSEVRFAAPAVPPAAPMDSISLSMGVVAGLVLGLLLALSYVLLADYLGRQPFLRRQQVAQ